MASSVMPMPTISIGVSERYVAIVKQGRVWNKIAKESATDMMVEHHDRRIRGHFTQGTQKKYGYLDRTLKTKQIKKYRYHVPGDLDLVKGGDTRQVVVGTRHISFRGSMTSGGGYNEMQVKMNMGRFPFPVGRGANKRIGPEEMRAEIARVLPEEGREMAAKYLSGILTRLRGLTRISAHLTKGEML